VISPGIDRRKRCLRSGVLSLIDMVALLQIRLQVAGGALVALVDQMPVLPEGTARLNSPRVVKGGNKRCKKRYKNALALSAESGGADRPDACRTN
jgi:hypothetical protein